MDTTTAKRAAGLGKSDTDRLREDMDELRHDLALLAENVSAAASLQARSSAAAADAKRHGAQHRTLAIGRSVGGEIRARPLTVAAVASVLGLLAVTACMWR